MMVGFRTKVQHMTSEDRKHALVTKPISDYLYAVINRGFDDYVIVGKERIR